MTRTGQRRRMLITAGPTHEPIDAVRFIGNRSSGRLGSALASEAAARGWDVTLLMGPVGVPTTATPDQSTSIDSKISMFRFRTAADLQGLLREHVAGADVLVMAAAVADWRPDIAANSKIKKSTDRVVPLIKLVENPDILAILAQSAQRPRLVIGFAAETDDVVQNAIAKRTRKGADWIIANDVSGDVMGGEKNRVHLISEAGVEDWPEMTKGEVGQQLAARIAQTLKGAA